jgi:hypothetical protein
MDNDHKRRKLNEIERNELEFKFSAMNSVLGKRPDSFGTASAFNILDNVMEGFEFFLKAHSDMLNQVDGKVQSALRGKVTHEIVAKCQEDIKQELDKVFSSSSSLMQDVLNHTIQLLQKSSTSPNKPGDRWENALESCIKDSHELKDHLGTMVLHPAPKWKESVPCRLIGRENQTIWIQNQVEQPYHQFGKFIQTRICSKKPRRPLPKSRLNYYRFMARSRRNLLLLVEKAIGFADQCTRGCN